MRTYPITNRMAKRMREFLREHNISYRFYTSLSPEVYRGYIWSLYWYHKKFYQTLSLYNLFKEVPLRSTKVRDIYYERYVQAHELIDRSISMEDFTVHLHLWGDSFEKSPTQIKKDLKSVSSTTYKAILDSIFYTDIYITRIPKIRHRFLIYLKKGAVYTIGRVSHTLKRKIDGGSPRYFTLRENKVIQNMDKEIGIVCDRLKFYKEFYE